METEFKFGEVHNLSSQIESGESRVQFKNIFGNENGGISLLAFRAGQKLDTHTAPAEVMVCVIEGEIEFTMLDTPHKIKAGEFMLMGANVAHSVAALTDAKVALFKVKP